MPITTDIGGKNFTLGRGRLFFDRFTPSQIQAGITASTQGEGERYFGNTPEFNSSSSEESLDHFSSEGGIRVKDDSVTLQIDRTGSITVDNIDAENLALLFLSDGVGSVTQSSATAVNWTTKAHKNRFYQIGSSPTVPTGVRNVSNIVVKKGVSFATTVTQAGNYEIDEVLGRIFILPNAADIPNDTDIQVTYDAAAGSREQVISSSQSIYGALHYIADNPKGTNRDMLMPYVKLTPDGDYNLKGDDWQSMTFSYEVLAKGNLKGVYLDGRPA